MIQNVFQSDAENAKSRYGALVSSDDIRNWNRLLVLGTIRRSGVASRTEVSTQTGLSPSTVSAITSDLIEEGVLMPLAHTPSASGRGRPQVALKVDPDAGIVCSVYFQLNSVSATVTDYAGAVIGEQAIKLSTLDINTGEIKAALISCIETALDSVKRRGVALSQIAVGFQGVVDVERTSVLWSPVCKSREMPVRRWLESHFEVPTIVSNDCDMIAVALHAREPEKFGENFAAVLLAEGVGMGLYLRDNIVNGTKSSGIEFGHMTYVPGGSVCRCGNRGCIEAYAGDYAIARRANGDNCDERPSDLQDPPDLVRIGEMARRGDKAALIAIQEAGAAIGTGLASLYALVDKFPIVLVGRGSAVFDIMEDSLRDALEASPGEKSAHDIGIHCYLDERPLVREGCAIRALMVQDSMLAERRITTEDVV